MPVPESEANASPKPQSDQRVADDLEARATFAKRPSVATLRRVRKTATFDTVGGAALVVGFAWPLVQALASGTVGGLAAGIIGGIVFFFASAFALGLIEVAWRGARATSLAFLLVSVVASLYWVRVLPPWGLAVMGAAVLGGLAMTWQLESKRLKGGFELPEAIMDALVALPDHLPTPLQKGLDDALAAHQQLGRALATFDDPAQRLLIGRTADDALAALIRQTRRQVELEAALEGGESATLVALRAEGRARLAEITRQIRDLREALLTLLVRHDAPASAALAERTEHLRLTAEALDELRRDGA